MSTATATRVADVRRSVRTAKVQSAVQMDRGRGDRAKRSASTLTDVAVRAPVPAFRLMLRLATRRDEVPLQFFFDALLRNDYFLRRGQLKEMLRGRYHQVWVAEIDTILVGVAITTRGTRLVNVLVHPSYRGLGIGRALVGQSGASEVRVKLNGRGGDPRGFYQALGFQQAKGDSGKDHIQLMSRTQTAAAER